MGASIFPKFGSLDKTEDDAFELSLVVNHSDLTSDDCLALLPNDPFIFDQAIQLGSQLPSTLTLSPKLKIKEVLYRLYDALFLHCGDRLTTVKQDGAIAHGK